MCGEYRRLHVPVCREVQTVWTHTDHATTTSDPLLQGIHVDTEGIRHSKKRVICSQVSLGSKELESGIGFLMFKKIPQGSGKGMKKAESSGIGTWPNGSD